MTEKEIFEEITDREYVNADRAVAKVVLSPEKLATFLAKHLPSE